MQNRLIRRQIIANIICITVCISYIYSQNCADGFTYFGELPETATITSGDSCLYKVDLDALNDIINENSLEYSSPIYIGVQTWQNRRLLGLVASYNPNGSGGVNAQLTVLPESFGDLSNLAFLYLEWNRLISLPSSFSQLTSLLSLTINNNWLTSLPEDFGNMNLLYFLDLGYNQLSAIPESICNMTNLQYLYLFNNEITTIPDCTCTFDIDWDGFDGGGFPYFGIGGNNLCPCTEDVPDCIENSSNFELTLDQFYYSIPMIAPQVCIQGDLNGDGNWNVLDIVNLANCVLAQNCAELVHGSAGDMNSDGNYNVLDIVTLANCILDQN